MSGFQIRVKDTKPAQIIRLEQRPYRIGRQEQGQNMPLPGYLLFREPTLSTDHAELRWDEKMACFILHHLSRTNPTMVGYVKLTEGQKRTLKAGESFQMGNLTLILERETSTAGVVATGPKGQLTPWEETKKQFRELLPRNRPPTISSEELSIFTRQFSAMIDAGIPIPRALAFFAEGAEQGGVRQIIEGCADKVMAGSRLSHAMRSYPQVFSEVYISLIETGENSGQIGTLLNRLADLLEKQQRMQKKVIATLTYPCILLLVSMLCVLVFIFMILPMIEPMFLSMKIDLPLPTRILLASRTLLVPGVSLTILAALAGWIFRPYVRAYLNKNKPLKLRLAQYPLLIPIFGQVARKIAVSRVLYSMSTMLDAGMTLVAAVQRASSVSGNAWIFDRMLLCKAAIVEGKTVAQSLRVTEVFPESAIQLITIGEETSNLATMVGYVANMYEEDADLALTDMANMLEPLLMGGMGLIVGFIVLSAMLPTLQLINSL